MLQAKTVQENETDSRKREHDKEASVMKNKVDELNDVNAKQKDELEFLRKHLVMYALCKSITFVLGAVIRSHWTLSSNQYL